MQHQTTDMTKRVTISVDDDVHEILEKWATEEVRTVANLAAALVTMAARDKAKELAATPKTTQ